MGQRAVILGGGESGVGAARLALRKGYDVFVSDSKQLSSKYAGILEGEGIEWEEGGHTMERVL
ncbi:MAG: hypothetical protein ABR94_10465, partial [Sphingobacteriales bacterium BACL12 MAG-120802-bin5]